MERDERVRGERGDVRGERGEHLGEEQGEERLPEERAFRGGAERMRRLTREDGGSSSKAERLGGCTHVSPASWSACCESEGV